jgi:hypothetical protein
MHVYIEATLKIAPLHATLKIAPLHPPPPYQINQNPSLHLDIGKQTFKQILNFLVFLFIHYFFIVRNILFIQEFLVSRKYFSK